MALSLNNVAPNDWIGLLADTEGYSALEALENGRYEYTEEDDDD